MGGWAWADEALAAVAARVWAKAGAGVAAGTAWGTAAAGGGAAAAWARVAAGAEAARAWAGAAAAAPGLEGGLAFLLGVAAGGVAAGVAVAARLRQQRPWRAAAGRPTWPLRRWQLSPPPAAGPAAAQHEAPGPAQPLPR